MSARKNSGARATKPSRLTVLWPYIVCIVAMSVTKVTLGLEHAGSLQMVTVYGDPSSETMCIDECVYFRGRMFLKRKVLCDLCPSVSVSSP